MGGIVGGSLQRPFCTECRDKKALDTHHDIVTFIIQQLSRHFIFNLKI